MSNEIFFRPPQEGEFLQINNRTMDAFMVILALGASSIAVSDEEKEWATWLASRNQTLTMPGCAGFGLADMPWHQDRFDSDRAFLLAAIDAAIAEKNWELLASEFRRDWIRDLLPKFRRMVEGIKPDEIPEPSRLVWVFGRPETLEMCHKHELYQYQGRCMICLDTQSQINAVTDRSIRRFEEFMGRKVKEPGRD